MKDFWFGLKTKAYFGNNCFERLSEIKKYSGNVLLVTGRTFAKKSGLLDRVKSALNDAGVRTEVFSEVEENPTTHTVDRGAEFCRSKGCTAVLGIGGGSPMDAAKGIAVLVTNNGKCNDYFGEDKFTEKPLPLFMIPTTAGTGSEITRYAVIVDTETGSKKTIASLDVMPELSFCAPELTLSLSPFLTAATGMDALSHAIEGFLSTDASEITDVIAVESMRIINESLPKTVRDLGNIELRAKMMLASMMAGIVINHAGTIAVHGIGYVLTIFCAKQHGDANAIIIPYVLDYMKKKGEKKVPELEKVLGTDDIKGYLKNFNVSIGLSPDLKSAGVSEDKLELLIEKSKINNERALKRMNVILDTEDYRKIYSDAFGR